MGHIGPSWGHLGAILGHLGAVLGLPWGRYGPSWGHLGTIFRTSRPPARPIRRRMLLIRRDHEEQHVSVHDTSAKLGMAHELAHCLWPGKCRAKNAKARANFLSRGDKPSAKGSLAGSPPTGVRGCPEFSARGCPLFFLFCFLSVLFSLKEESKKEQEGCEKSFLSAASEPCSESSRAEILRGLFCLGALLRKLESKAPGLHLLRGPAPKARKQGSRKQDSQRICFELRKLENQILFSCLKFSFEAFCLRTPPIQIRGCGRSLRAAKLNPAAFREELQGRSVTKRS